MVRAKLLSRPRGRWWPEGRMDNRETSPDSARRMHGFLWRGGILRLACMMWLVSTVCGRLTMQSSSSTSSFRGSSDSRSSSPYPSTPSPKMPSSTTISTDSDELELRKTMPVFPGDVSELRKDPPGLFEKVEESTSEESTGKGEEDGKPRQERFFKDYNSQELSDLAGDILEACKPLMEEADEHERKTLPELEAWARDKAESIVDNMPSDEYPCPHELVDSEEDRVIEAMGDSYLDDPDYKQWDADGLGWKSGCWPAEEREEELKELEARKCQAASDSGGDRVMKEERDGVGIWQPDQGEQAQPPPGGEIDSGRGSSVDIPLREGEDDGVMGS